MSHQNRILVVDNKWIWNPTKQNREQRVIFGKKMLKYEHPCSLYKVDMNYSHFFLRKSMNPCFRRIKGTNMLQTTQTLSKFQKSVNRLSSRMKTCEKTKPNQNKDRYDVKQIDSSQQVSIRLI